MMLNENLNNVSVVGASGKMGSGISLLLLQEMTRLSWLGENDARKDLFLVDRNQGALDGLKSYLKNQITKYAEKNITWIKKEVAQDDQEQIDGFVDQALKITNFSTNLGVVKDSNMVFEAIFERLDIKTQLLKDLKKICPPKTNFFSNTSSIPISIVEKSAGVEGRLIGFHFYNPPAVQKLVELISSEKTPQHLQQISLELGERLNKVMVPSNDIAGFIGNGHFMRDA
ncbi:MAG: 3-hydroxyacyl-CoA dehydrogenase family protein, partial [Proteobacteria bacterium]|nr:3-hydroxyacyl-CoA dehydrogenase family protein [Pseudomonadota bacterium]